MEIKLNIPTRKPDSGNDLLNLSQTEDAEKIKSVPMHFQDMAKFIIDKYNSKRNLVISKAREEAELEKSTFFSAFNSTYSQLVQACNSNIAHGKFKVNIKGGYKGEKERTILNWELNNPGQAKAIEILSQELQIKGYNPPTKKLSEYTVDTEFYTTYNGGEEMILEFNLKTNN